MPSGRHRTVPPGESIPHGPPPGKPSRRRYIRSTCQSSAARDRNPGSHPCRNRADCTGSPGRSAAQIPLTPLWGSPGDRWAGDPEIQLPQSPSGRWLYPCPWRPLSAGQPLQWAHLFWGGNPPHPGCQDRQKAYWVPKTCRSLRRTGGYSPPHRRKLRCPASDRCRRNPARSKRFVSYCAPYEKIFLFLPRHAAILAAQTYLYQKQDILQPLCPHLFSMAAATSRATFIMVVKDSCRCWEVVSSPVRI